MTEKKNLSRRKFIESVLVGGIGGAILSTGVAVSGSAMAQARPGH